MDFNFTEEEKTRYRHHFSLPMVGIEGQQKLKNARVCCIGAGGLGSPVLLYLAAAGVGTLGIIDFDVVELSNLQRQIIYSFDELGQKKVIAAKKRLLAINPNVNVIVHEEKLNMNNAFALLESYDIIVDGTDNFSTRYLINDVCFYLKKPNVSASIFQFEGQCAVFSAPGPCYRCLYASPPPDYLIPSCHEGGVLGVMPGLLGTIQAAEVIKLIINIGHPLVGRLLVVDALNLRFTEFKLERNPDCILCHHQQSFSTLPRFQEKVCMQNKVEEITVQELALLQEQEADILVLDVREQSEYDEFNINGKLIPLAELPNRLSELDRDKLIVVHCKSGGRSTRAAQYLLEQGFDKVKNLKGGMTAWREEIKK
jgi:molybdopterin/thiamine biosynthesis adenylyltransferase/rhodanese-related sulfurtransferase